MKNLKIIMLSLTWIGLLTLSQSAISVPTFELINKNNKTITVAMIIRGKLLTTDVKPNGKIASETININEPIVLGIYNQQTSNISLGYNKDWDTFFFIPHPYETYSLDVPGKTKYLIWELKDRRWKLQPQTRAFMSLSGKSPSGYSLENNINKDDIIAVVH